jgi:hypothetical protein
MKIIALRAMFLSGKAVEKSGKPQDVSNKDGDLAIRMGWATLPDKETKEKKETTVED